MLHRLKETCRSVAEIPSLTKRKRETSKLEKPKNYWHITQFQISPGVLSLFHKIVSGLVITKPFFK